MAIEDVACYLLNLPRPTLRAEVPVALINNDALHRLDNVWIGLPIIMMNRLPQTPEEITSCYLQAVIAERLEDPATSRHLRSKSATHQSRAVRT